MNNLNFEGPFDEGPFDEVKEESLEISEVSPKKFKSIYD